MSLPDSKPGDPDGASPPTGGISSEPCNLAFYAENLGCGSAELDLSRNISSLIGAGLRRVESPSEADIVLVQTCSVLGTLARRSLDRVGELGEKLPESRQLVALGCAVASEREEFEGLRKRDPRLHLVANDEKLASSLELPWGTLHSSSAAPIGVRVARGCASGCAFCSIRLSQGRLRSSSVEELAAEVEAILESGREVVNLYGEDVGAYGLDLRLTLPDLLEALHRRFPAAVFRLATINPQWFQRYQEFLVDYFVDGILAPELYCPAQSGSSRVLRMMRRGYDAETVYRVYETVIDRIPEVRLYQDFLLGHPGETLEDFEETCRLAGSFSFHATDVRAFEPRPGTVSSRMDDQIGEDEKQRRVREVASICLRRFWRDRGIPGSERLRMLLDGSVPVYSNVPLLGLVPGKSLKKEIRA